MWLLSRLPQRWRTELRDLVELILAPGLASVLPWRLCFQVFRLLSRAPWLYRAGSVAALSQAKARRQVPEGRELEWLATRRLVTLVDHADQYLAATRSDRFMARHLDVNGHWGDPTKAGVCLTFHWGAGMWALRHAGASGLQAHALVAAMQGTPFAGRAVLQHYVIARTSSVGKALGRAPLVVSGSLRPVIQALRHQQQVFAAVDVPADQVDSSVEVNLRGMQARVPKGLLRLALDLKVPVTVYVTGFDVTTGRRHLKIAQIPKPMDGLTVQELAQRVFDQLNEALETNNAYWHFWSEAPRIFCEPLHADHTPAPSS
ncbi:MAG: hypothetical protein QE495_06825 [Acidovorax sp.]|uniref:hypothetical protein n=1 Tax=Acidovorax sp. TaxID=1872122 RepID=UPI0026365F62|nr:hypothetical protein [Acidovorax sp.]MDH4426149.1 hypothetical protein [Acidovorax sp.]